MARSTNVQSARGVFYDINCSNLYIVVNDLTFYFSSQYNYKRFKKRYDEETKIFNDKINNIYKNFYCLEFDELALIRLYVKIEKRGFLLLYKGKKIDCLNRIIFKTKLEIE